MTTLFLVIFTLALISTISTERLTIDKLLVDVRKLKVGKIAVAGGESEESLKAVRKAKDNGIADALLIGNEKKIKEIAQINNIDISDFEIINEEDEEKVAPVAVKLVKEGKAEMYMKGHVNSKDYFKAYLDKKTGLRRGNRVISVVTLVELEEVDRLLFLTDGALTMYPTLKEKVDLINNAVEVSKAIGIKMPKVAPLAAVEVVNPKMKECVEAKELTDMNDRGEIKDCIVDGPLSFDLAIDPEAAKLKGTMNRKIKGDADILLFPDIPSGNIAYKLISHLSNPKVATVLAGASAPCIFSSRSDSFETKFNSIVLAAYYANYLRNSLKN